MRKIAILLIVAGIVVSFALSLTAGSLAGVTLPDTAQVGSTTLVLNGLGLRTKFMVKVYVAGLYLTQKSPDAGAILKPDAPKRIVMHFMRDVSKNQLADGFNESFRNNTPETAKTLKPEIDRLFAALDSVKNNDEIVFTYIPGEGTSMARAGNDKLTIANPAFAEMLFSVWLGPKPPNESLKKGILGQ